jgi:hypothetical protein
MPKRTNSGRAVSAGGSTAKRQPGGPRRSNVGRAISTLAGLYGMNHKTLAAEAGLNDKTLSEWKGGVAPKPASLRSIAGALKCQPEMIMELAELFDRFQNRAGAAEPAGSLQQRTYEELQIELGQLETKRLEVTTEMQERIAARNRQPRHGAE